MKVLLGGTFSVVHKAHREMILRGARLGELYIGLTSDNFNFKKDYKVPPYAQRKDGIESYLKRERIEAKIMELKDPYGATLSPDADAIVTSNENFDFIQQINFTRKSKGFKPLVVENVGTILAEDFMPVKSERIMKGTIDEDGKRIRKIGILISSSNEEKIAGAEKFFSSIFNNYELQNTENTNSFHPQPMGQELFEGALRRVEEVKGDYDYAVGIEAGIISLSGRDFDMHVAAVRDSIGKTTFGISSGLYLGGNIMEYVKNGEELESVTDRLIGIKDTGRYKGASFYFTNGMKERRTLVEESLLSAFVERIADSIPKKSK